MTVDRETRRRDLFARQHLARTASSVLDLVGDLLLHSSDPLTPHLAAWARVPDYRTQDLEAGLASGQLWRLHAMRRTIWVAPTDQVPMLDDATGAAMARKERARVLKWTRAVRDDAEAFLADLETRVLAAVDAEPGVMTRTLSKTVQGLSTRVLVGSGKWKQEAALASRLMFVLAMELKIKRTAPSGSWKSSQYGWTTATPVPSVQDGLMRLLRHYIGHFGPVTDTDIFWWTGLNKRPIRQVLDRVAVPVQTDDGPAWVLPGWEPQSARGVALLPGLDPTPMGWKQRDWFLGDHQKALFDRNGNIGPTVWVDGRIVGGWGVVGGTVKVKRLEPVDADSVEAIDAHAQALQEWLGGEDITPRFRTPLEKGLT